MSPIRLLALMGLAGGLLFAQTTGKQAKVEALLELTDAKTTVDRVFAQMRSMVESRVPPNASPEERARAAEMQQRVLDLVSSRLSWETLKPLYLRIYNETFTEEEIDGMLTFYRTPVGQSMLKKMPELMKRSIELVNERMKDLMPEIRRITRGTGSQ